jgi:hypothetical protein
MATAPDRVEEAAEALAAAWDPNADRYDPALWVSDEPSLDQEAHLMMDLTDPDHWRSLRFSPGYRDEPDRWWCDLPKRKKDPNP